MEQDIPVPCLRRAQPPVRGSRPQRYDLSPVLRLETDRLDSMTDLVDPVDLFRKIERYLDLIMRGMSAGHRREPRS